MAPTASVFMVVPSWWTLAVVEERATIPATIALMDWTLL